jgi:hypothetical protein
VPNGYYELIGLIPSASDFTLERAVAHYSGLTFSRLRGRRWVFRDEPLRAEVVSSNLTPYNSPDAVEDNRYMSEKSGLPAPAEIIAGCSARLSISSDVDSPDFDNSDQFTQYTEHLRTRFGIFLYDNTNGEWWA